MSQSNQDNPFINYQANTVGNSQSRNADAFFNIQFEDKNGKIFRLGLPLFSEPNSGKEKVHPSLIALQEAVQPKLEDWQDKVNAETDDKKKKKLLEKRPTIKLRNFKYSVHIIDQNAHNDIEL